MDEAKSIRGILLQQKYHAEVIALANELATLRKMTATKTVVNILREVLPVRIAQAKGMVK